MCYVLAEVLYLSAKNKGYGNYTINKQGQHRSLYQPDEGCIIHREWKRDKNPLRERTNIRRKRIIENGGTSH